MWVCVVLLEYMLQTVLKSVFLWIKSIIWSGFLLYCNRIGFSIPIMAGWYFKIEFLWVLVSVSSDYFWGFKLTSVLDLIVWHAHIGLIGWWLGTWRLKNEFYFIFFLVCGLKIASTLWVLAVSQCEWWLLLRYQINQCWIWLSDMLIWFWFPEFAPWMQSKLITCRGHFFI